MAEELNLAEVDLRKQVRNLSLGQRMKGELILSFLHLPTIIFLDEPTLGLDFVTQRAIRNYLIGKQEGRFLLSDFFRQKEPSPVSVPQES